MALIDADYFNLHNTTLGLKSSFTPKAEQLSQLIEDASEFIESECRRVLAKGSVTDIVRGNGLTRLILREWPVASIESIAWVDDIGATGTVDPTILRLLPGGIIEFKNVLNGPWYTTRTYTFTYTAGYDPVPANLKRATALKVVDLMGPQYTGAREARSVDVITNVEAQIALLIEKYRRSGG